MVSLINIFLTSFTTIAVASIGAHQKRRTRETAEYRKLREENELLKQEKDAKWKEENDGRLRRIENSISTLTGEVTSIKEKDMKHIEMIESQLSQIHTLNQVNFEYVQSLSNVVKVVGESVAKTSAIKETERKKVSHELNVHRAKEDNITKELYKIIV